MNIPLLFIIPFDYSIVGSRIDTRRMLQQLLCTTNGQIEYAPKVRCSDDHKAFGLQNTILVDPRVSVMLTYFWSADIKSLKLMFSLMSLTIITYPAPRAFLTVSQVCCCVSPYASDLNQTISEGLCYGKTLDLNVPVVGTFFKLVL